MECEACSSPAVDEKLFAVFGVAVCDCCKKTHPDKYSLLTKTAAMKEFLLTAEELEDRDRLPHLERPNPHNTSWQNMQLFLRKQLAAFALAKHGSLDALEKSREEWIGEKVKRKEKRYSTKLRELRKKTRSDTWTPRESGQARHRHTFKEDATGKECTECGFRIKFELCRT